MDGILGDDSAIVSERGFNEAIRRARRGETHQHCWDRTCPDDRHRDDIHRRWQMHERHVCPATSALQEQSALVQRLLPDTGDCVRQPGRLADRQSLVQQQLEHPLAFGRCPRPAARRRRAARTRRAGDCCQPTTSPALHQARRHECFRTTWSVHAPAPAFVRSKDRGQSGDGFENAMRRLVEDQRVR